MDDNTNLSREEKLRAENEFLQMKIMLEHGAEFHVPEGQDEELDPEIQNHFLNNIIEFEKQWESGKVTTVFDKIGRPDHFPPVHLLAAQSMEDEWRKLSDYMLQYGIGLEACSPKVTANELYRFTTEELFQQETDDISIPGFITNFIYDEFYPDHEYENTGHAVDYCIREILRKEPLNYMTWFAKDDLRLNSHQHLRDEEFKSIVNNFKNKFNDIELKDIEDVNCKLRETTCEVTGTYLAVLTFDGIDSIAKGNWLVEFVLQEEYWNIVSVKIENVGL